MRRSLMHLISAVVITAGVAVSPAQAAPSQQPPTKLALQSEKGAPQLPPSPQDLGQCTPIRHVCLWEHHGYGGVYGAWDDSVPKLPTSLHNKVSSLYNRLTGAVVFYTDDNYTGNGWCVDADERWDTLHTSATAGWHDNIESFQYWGGYQCAEERTARPVPQ